MAEKGSYIPAYANHFVAAKHDQEGELQFNLARRRHEFERLLIAEEPNPVGHCLARTGQQQLLTVDVNQLDAVFRVVDIQDASGFLDDYLGGKTVDVAAVDHECLWYEIQFDFQTPVLLHPLRKQSLISCQRSMRTRRSLMTKASGMPGQTGMSAQLLRRTPTRSQGTSCCAAEGRPSLLKSCWPFPLTSFRTVTLRIWH